MIYCIDIGNTNVVCAKWNGKKYCEFHRFDTIIPLDKHLNSLDFKNIKNIIISSVVPKITQYYANKINNKNIFIVNHLNCKIKLKVDFPNEVGPDRICNSYAASKKYSPPIIIVDFGSATTYDVIDENGSFIGGAIAPGIDISAYNLIKKTALLKKAIFKFPDKTIGKNTIDNLKSGIMLGGVDSVDGMLKRIKNELNNKRKLTILLTGGFSSLISPMLKTKHFLVPNLTLDGMRLIFKHNQN